MRFLRVPDACALTGLSRSTLYGGVTAGLMPRPVKISARASGWPEHELLAVNRARLAGKSADEIRALVQELVAARQQPQAA